MNLRFIRKALATVSAISIALTAVIIPSAPAVSAAGEWYAPYVDALFDLGIVDSTGSAYNPAGLLTRAALSAMLNRTVGFAVDASEVDDPGFSDVSTGDWFYVDVAALENAGVVQGTTPTTFSPGANVTRAAASKMISLALDIPTSEDDVPFGDVASNDWFESYVGSLYWNSVVDGVGGANSFDPAGFITRAAMGKMLALAIAVSEAEESTYARVAGDSAFASYSAEEIVALITGGELPEEGEEEEGGVSDASFSVSLASDTPMTATIPANGFNVPYTYITFSAGPEEGVKITGLIVTRTGLGASGNFTNVKLYSGLTQLSSEKTISSQYNTATFNLNSTPVMVGAGSSKTVRILGDMLVGGTPAGVSNQLGVASANDVTAVGAETGGSVTVGGSFPVYGNLMTTSAALVGTLTYDVTDPHGAAPSTFYIGDQDRVMTRINISTATEDMDVIALTFRQEGSAGNDEVANLSLYHNGALVAGPVQMVNRYVTFELFDPLFVERGSSTNLELRGDIVGGYNKDVGFDIYRDWHINAVGRVYGYPVRVVDNNTAFAITVDNITGSRLSFSVGQRNPTVGDVKPNAKDFVGLQFNIINTGDVVDIRNLPLGIDIVDNGGGITAADLSDVKIWRLDDDFNFINVVAGPIDPTGAQAGGGAGAGGWEMLVFTDVFEVEANTTAKFAVTYDLINTAIAGDNALLSLIQPDGTSAGAWTGNVTSGFEVRNVVTGDIIYTNTTLAPRKINIDVGGNIRTVASPSLAFTLANAPATDAFVVNSTNVPVAAFNARAGSADDVTITSLNLSLLEAVGGPGVRSYTCNAAGAVSSSDLSSVKLYSDIDGTETLLDGPEEISGTTVNFTGFNLDVPAGETVRILIRANIPSSATANVCPTFSIPATTGATTVTTNVTANDSDGRSLATAQKIVPVGGVNITPTAFVLAAASGRIQVTASNDTPNEGQVIAGAEDVPVAKFKFEASTVEDVEIHKLRLFNATAATDSAIDTVKLWDGDTLVASGTVSAGYVTWENLALTIPRNSSKTITVTVTFNDSNTIQTIAGMAPRFVILNLEDNWADGVAATAPNGAIATGGDMKAVGKQSGQLLNNIALGTDAVAGDRGFWTAAGAPNDENFCDSAGSVTGTLTAVCAAGGATYPITGNTLTEAQYVYNTKLTLSLEGGANGTPVGNQGGAGGAGNEVTIFKFRVAAAANSSASNPREAILQDLYFTVSGDAEADSFNLYGPSSTSTPMATSTVVHRTNTVGFDGSAAPNHATRTTVIPFTSLAGTDSKIGYGQDKVYTLKADVYGITDTDSPVRSLRVFLDNYGTSAGASDLVWLDNGTVASNANSQAVYWVHEEGVDELRPSSPMTYSSGSSYITATTAAALLAGSRATAATTVQVFFTLPMDVATVDTAPSTVFDVDALGTDVGAAGADVSAFTAAVSGNVVTITDVGGASFALSTASWDATPPWLDITSATVDLEALGSGGSGTNTPYVDTSDNVIRQNF